ncbi:MAG TPA: flavoprotein [Planctomycetota bacterium]|nr:flavoprotein [Planctomycetota bacterium]
MARLVLGVSGSIAAYKAVDLCSKCVQAGHTVDVVMTRMADRFVRPLSFSALTQRAVFTDETWGDGDRPAAHLAMTEGADLLVVAPATADAIGKMANGIADEILSTTYLGASCPVLVAPAMNQRMWRHPRVVANVERIVKDGVEIVEPGTGWLAEGDTGPGRMAEPAQVLEAIARRLAKTRK